MSKFQGVNWEIFDESHLSITGRSATIQIVAMQAISDRSKKNWTDGCFPVEFQGCYFEIASSTKEAPAIAIGNTPESARANAQLIAAAPMLLQLLIESQESIGGDWRERRDAVIAEVTMAKND